MKYNISRENVYEAQVRGINGHEDRAIIICRNHMGNTEYYPYDNEMDASVLLTECMGINPEEYDPASPETRRWIENWSYPIEQATEIARQINQ